MNFIYPLSRYIKITQVYWSQHLGLDFGWNDGASTMPFTLVVKPNNKE